MYTDPDLELPISIFGRGGTGPEAALACFLDNPSESTWYYPDGSAVAISNEYPPTGTFIYVRRATAITLHRDPAAFSPTGRYCCGLSTVPVEERLCVNIGKSQSGLQSVSLEWSHWGKQFMTDLGCKTVILGLYNFGSLNIIVTHSLV